MTDPAIKVTDPVCGMTVDPATARAAGLSSEHEGQTYYFCARGCKLDFEEDPVKFLGPKHAPPVEM